MNKKTLRILILLLLIAWVGPIVACNMPPPVDTVDRAVQETLLATLFPQTTLSPNDQFPGLATLPPGDPPPVQIPAPSGDLLPYLTQSGDTLQALAARFGVPADQITSPGPLPSGQLLQPGQLLMIPNLLTEIAPGNAIMPDSEVIYSPTGIGFHVDTYVHSAGGFLASYSEEVEGEQLSGAQIIQRIADELSIHPRILLAVLQHETNWVLGQPTDPTNLAFPIGFMVPEYRGLYKEMTLVGRQLTVGFYGWRAGNVVSLQFPDGTSMRLHPSLNAGSVAVQYLFAVLYNRDGWSGNLYGEHSFSATYQQMFGDPWQTAAPFEPNIPSDLSPPVLELPFAPGEAWSYTGGPHNAWGVGSARGAVDFAPVRDTKGCTVSDAWVTAGAPGRVVRSGNGQVIIDMDGDGFEQTGWALLYLHIASRDRVAVGTWVETNQPIGHPSCEGGVASGTHVHFSRKYNGEWMPAGPPTPMILSGWQVVMGEKAYRGELHRDGQVVTANPDGSAQTLIIR